MKIEVLRARNEELWRITTTRMRMRIRHKGSDSGVTTFHVYGSNVLF